MRYAPPYINIVNESLVLPEQCVAFPLHAHRRTQKCTSAHTHTHTHTESLKNNRPQGTAKQAHKGQQ